MIDIGVSREPHYLDDIWKSWKKFNECVTTPIPSIVDIVGEAPPRDQYLEVAN